MKSRALALDILLVSGLLSLLLSLWCVSQKEVINYDTVLYLRAAKLFAEGDWQAALPLYRWPFYAWLIAMLANITGLGFEAVAQLLNALLTALLIAAFLQVIATLGGNRRHQLAAAAILLCYPGLNEYRGFIIRDMGFLACYFFALQQFLRYKQNRHWVHGIAWAGLVLLSGLFRIEGFAFWLLVPLLRPSQAKHSPYLWGLYLGLPLLLGMVVAWWLSTPSATGASSLMAFGYQLQAHIGEQWAALQTQVLPPLASDHVGLVWMSMVAMIFLAEVLARLTPLYALLVCYAYIKKLGFFDAPIRGTWYSLIFLYTLILLTYVTAYTFLTGRHPLALAMTLMLAAPFALVALHKKWQTHTASKWQRWAFPVSLFIMLAFLIDSTNSLSPGKVYVKQAGQWIKTHSRQEDLLFSNYHILIYYAGKNSFHEDQDYSWSTTLKNLQEAPKAHYDYIALRFKHKEKDKEQQIWELLKQPPVQRFENSVGDRVLIFDLRS